jgi:hypothetical protein
MGRGYAAELITSGSFRPLCPYPQVAQWKGSDNRDEAQTSRA